MKGTTGINRRRDAAKIVLEAQLKMGTKPEKIEGKTTSNRIPLTESDKNRINREIEYLSTKKKTY